MKLAGKIIVFCLFALLVAVAIFAWKNSMLAPEMLMAVVTAFSILGIAAAFIAVTLSLQIRRETASLSHLVEEAVDRLEQRHDSDHARLVMALAGFDARVPQQQIDLTKVISPRAEKEDETFNINALSSGTLAFNTGKNRASGTSANTNITAHNSHIAALVESALASNKLPLSLEPIFEMPSATVRGYIAYAQFDGIHVRRPALQSSESIGKFEYQLAFAVAKFARQLLKSENALPIFCSISSESLGNAQHLEQLFDVQPALKEKLILLVPGIADKQPIIQNISRLQHAGFQIAVEGDADFLDALSPITFSHWLVGAGSLVENKVMKSPSSFHHTAGGRKMPIIALDCGDETQFGQLIDRDVNLVTSSLLSSPRLVRT